MLALGVVAFALAIGVAIMLHEAGHLLTAKAFGMKCTEYFVGFGPKIFSFRRGETEYGVKAIPAGGYVKITGMTDLEELEPGDEQRAFYRQPAPQRLVVLVAGSLTHFVLAFLTLYVAVVFFGYSTYTPEQTQVQVAPCVTPAGQEECRPDDPVSPSVLAGLRDGDVVTSVDGDGVRSYDQLVKAIQASGVGPVPFLVDRDGQEVALTADLVERTAETADGQQATVPFLGVSPESPDVRTFGPVEGIGRGWEATVDLFELTGESLLSLPSKIPNLWESVFFGEERDPNGVISVVGASRAGGQAVDAGFVEGALFLFAGLNIFIGAFNLFPLLPLDGGHVAILLYERARAGVARLFGRSDPGRVDIRKLLPLTYAVVLVGGVFALLAITADFVNPVANPFR